VIYQAVRQSSLLEAISQAGGISNEAGGYAIITRGTHGASADANGSGQATVPTEPQTINVNLHELLLENRYESVAHGNASLSERIAWKAWRMASLHRSMMNMGNAKTKNWLVNRMFKGWSTLRDDLHFADKTFNQRWKERSIQS